jgi:capsular polysaccharide biosynthesis protein
MSGVTLDQQAIDTKRLRSQLHRRSGVVAASTLLGAIALTVVAMILAPAYVSTSLLLMSSASGSSQQSTTDGETQAEIARSEPVLQRAIERLDAEVSVTALAEQVETSLPTPILLEIAASAPSAEDAELLAAAVAESYLEYTEGNASKAQARARDAIRLELRNLRELAESLDEEIRRASAQQEGPPDRNSSAVATLSAQRSDVALQITSLRGQLNGSKPTDSAPLGTLDAEIIESGTAATRPSPALRAMAAGFVGGLLGFVVGAGAVLFRGRHERVTWDQADVAQSLGAPVLAELPGVTCQRADEWANLVATYHPTPSTSWGVLNLLRDLSAATATGSPGPELLRVSVASLLGDVRGLSLGPVIAKTAASLGIQTDLRVMDSGLDDRIVAGMAQARSGRRAAPHLTVSRHDHKAPDGTQLTIDVVIVDPSDPLAPHLPVADALLLALGPGSAALDDVALLSLTADQQGMAFSGVVVADGPAWSRRVAVDTDSSMMPAPEPDDVMAARQVSSA